MLFQIITGWGKKIKDLGLIMFQCLLCMLSSLLMLLPSLISFLVRSLYISYYSYWVSVSFCFLFFVFSLIAASEGNLLIPYSVSFSLPSALGRYSIPFSFFFCTLFCVIHHIYLFSFYRVFTAICFLVFLLLPASYFFPPSLKETYGNSFLFNKNSPSRKKKA